MDGGIAVARVAQIPLFPRHLVGRVQARRVCEEGFEEGLEAGDGGTDHGCADFNGRPASEGAIGSMLVLSVCENIKIRMFGVVRLTRW